MQESIQSDINAIKVDNYFSEGPYDEHHHGQSSNTSSISSYINGMLDPPSIFASSTSSPSLDDYLKIKNRDKPKDTLLLIQQKKQAFIRYTDPRQLQPPQEGCERGQNKRQPPSRMKQQFPQFTFYKNCKANTLLFIRILPSRSCKCNIWIVNLLGEVLKYYPNVFTSKKQGKIMKFITDHKDTLLFVFDYTQIQRTLKTFPSLLNETKLLYYQIFNSERIHQETASLTRQKIEKNGSNGVLISENTSMILMSNLVHTLHTGGHLAQVYRRLHKIEKQQQQFLISLRGRKASGECSLAYDVLMVNLWKQFKHQGPELINQIIILFNKKEFQMNKLIFNEPQVSHTPKRMDTSQNCSLCLSNNPEIKRPKRTHWICGSCSALKEKPIYLCKGCFKNFHTNNDLYLFRKNEKKTKKVRRIAKKMIQKNRKEGAGFNDEEQNHPNNVPTEKQKRLVELDQNCQRFFLKIDELIEEKSFQAVEFYHHMLLNMTILKTHEYLSKMDSKPSFNIKIEEA